MRRLVRAAYIAVLAVAILSAVALFFRARWFARRHAEAITQVVRLEAEKSAIVAEARLVKHIEAPPAARKVIRAGARVAGKVEARIEAKSEAVGTATVTEGSIGASDEHKRFLVAIPYTCKAPCQIETSEARWNVTQRFQLEAVEFEQTGMEDAVAFKGFSATITERSPVDDTELHRYVAKREDITAVYTVPRSKRRWIAPFANIGLEYLPNTGSTVPYGLVGVRVRRLGVWVGTFGSTPAVGVGWSFGP